MAAKAFFQNVDCVRPRITISRQIARLAMMRAYSMGAIGAVTLKAKKLMRLPITMVASPRRNAFTRVRGTETVISFRMAAILKATKLAIRNKSFQLKTSQRVGFLNPRVANEARRSQVAILSQEGILGEYFI
jgi:hypothetical protein